MKKKRFTNGVEIFINVFLDVSTKLYGYFV